MKNEVPSVYIFEEFIYMEPKFVNLTPKSIAAVLSNFDVHLEMAVWLYLDFPIDLKFDGCLHSQNYFSNRFFSL